MTAILDQNSTYSDAKKAYQENSAYFINDSATEAQKFIQACMILVHLAPDYANYVNRNELRIRTQKYETQAAEARRWLSSHSDDYGGVTFASFTNFR